MEDVLWNIIVYGIGTFSIIQIIRLVFADADLQLLYKFRFGKNPECLAGKTVWITGASSGIGEYLAYDLAKVGCKLILSARSVSDLEKVRKQCQTYGKIKEEDIIVKKLDLVDFESHKQIVEEVLAVVPQIDILVNNGGRSQRSLIIDSSLEVDKEIFDLNVLGTISFTKAVLPHFIEKKNGHVVVTSSVAGKFGVPASATYSASKHALQGWFETMRVECNELGIDVTLVCPGPVYSNLLRVAFTGEIGKINGKDMQAGENRMKTERCTELMTVAIANKLGEVWISNQPILFCTYVFQYMPDIARWIAKRAGMKTIKKFRDSKR